jgi:ribonucleoside-diphosphate reductase alpha chain
MTTTLLSQSDRITPFEQYADRVMQLRYSHTVEYRQETWSEICFRVCKTILAASGMTVHSSLFDSMYRIMVQRKFIPGGRILSQTGRAYHQTDNCFTLQAEDSREGWADLAHKCSLMFMSGGGVGIEYGYVRPYGAYLKRSGGMASGPLPLIQMIDSIAATVRQGGERRGACYASLPWYHRDVSDFIALKDELGPLPHTNISVRFDPSFIQAYHEHGEYSEHAHTVFKDTVKHACQYGDPGFQFDSDDQVLRNACGEIISKDDSDSCCLGSVNFAAISNLEELREVTELGIFFLLCNTLYTDKPTGKVAQVKEQNRRLGLGIMGIGEWFIQRGLPYGSGTDIRPWLHTWKRACITAARSSADVLSVQIPIATRAIAPTGTISIVGGHTTSGIEPVFHTAYQRTYNTLKTAQYQDGFKKDIVIDPIVRKWIDQGYSVYDIDTAYTLSQSIEGIERRIAFQAMCQSYVDNAISSTVNLPAYTEGIEEQIAPILLKYLPELRGITFYPDGRHTNQPVIPIDIHAALEYNAALVESDSCKNGICNT